MDSSNNHCNGCMRCTAIGAKLPCKTTGNRGKPVAPSATVIPRHLMHNEEIDLIKHDLKQVINLKFDRVTGRTGGFDEEIVDDEDGKLALFEDVAIRELLDALVSEQEEKLFKLKKTQHKDYDDLLKEELEDVLREMAVEAEEVEV